MPVPYSAAADALDEYRRKREEREMREALEADGEKLRQIMGRDHGPWDLPEPPEQWIECSACDGNGCIVKRVTVYEHGCGFPHDDGEEVECEQCHGNGGWIDDAEATP